MKMVGQYCYEYPRPAVSVDIVLLSGKGRVLLIRRKGDPFKDSWALPGGFVEIDETLADAAARELREETGLAGVEMRQLRAFDAPNRDPRGRTISVAFLGTVETEPPPKAGDDAADARWLPAAELPPMAFDHAAIIACALDAAERDTKHRNETFTARAPKAGGHGTKH